MSLLYHLVSVLNSLLELDVMDNLQNKTLLDHEYLEVAMITKVKQNEIRVVYLKLVFCLYTCSSTLFHRP